MTPSPLYLDYASSSSPAPEVIEAMMPWLTQSHANPHADHWHGRRAADAVEEARHAIAGLIGGDPQGVVFTSGATEANNLALKGLLGRKSMLQQLWLSTLEHKSLLEPAQYLACSDGVRVRHIPVSSTGKIEAAAMAQALAEHDGVPGMVAISHGNNEIGTVQEVPTLSELVHHHGHLLHLDASQTAGHLPIAVEADDIDLLCLSSHKIYGPAGIGALYVDPILLSSVHPLLHGGGQQGGVRSGTLAPFLAVGFGAAAALSRRRMAEHAAHLRHLAVTFIEALRAERLAFRLIGEPSNRLPGHLSIQFSGVAADDILTRLSPVLSASTGAACSSGEWRASHVLRAIGLSEEEAGQVVRLSFGRDALPGEAIIAAQLLGAAVRRVAEGEGRC